MRTSPVNIRPVANNAGDAGSIMGYTHYLMMNAQFAGNLRFDGHKATEEEVEVAERCRVLCDRITRRLALCKENDIPDMLECYDIAYRIGNRCVPDSGFINRQKRRVLKAWKSGFASVDESSVFGMVAPEVSRTPERAEREYVEAYLSIKERWLRTLAAHNCFPGVTAYENYRRLALMMRERLDSRFDGQDADVKRRWYERNKVDDFSTLGSRILRCYRRFISSLSPAVMDFDQKMELDNCIIAELSTRQDLNPYDREAFRLALEFNREMAEE